MTPKARAQEALDQIYVTFVQNDLGGLNIRKWDRYPFEGATAYSTPSPAINQELAEAMTTAAFWMANAVSNEGFISPELKGKYVDALEALEKHAAAVKQGQEK